MGSTNTISPDTKYIFGFQWPVSVNQSCNPPEALSMASFISDTSSLETIWSSPIMALEWKIRQRVSSHNLRTFVDLTPPPTITLIALFFKSGLDDKLQRKSLERALILSSALFPAKPPLVKIELNPHLFKSDKLVFHLDSGIKSNARWKVHGRPSANCTSWVLRLMSISFDWSCLDCWRIPKTNPSAPTLFRFSNVAFISSKSTSS